MATGQACCAGCCRPVVQQRVWTSATRQERDGWHAAGLRMLKGHGLCSGCYQRAYYQRKLPTVIQDHAVPAPCPRCGVPSPTGLCQDCSEVTAELNETARWVA